VKDSEYVHGGRKSRRFNPWGKQIYKMKMEINTLQGTHLSILHRAPSEFIKSNEQGDSITVIGLARGRKVELHLGENAKARNPSKVHTSFGRSVW